MTTAAAASEPLAPSTESIASLGERADSGHSTHSGALGGPAVEPLLVRKLSDIAEGYSCFGKSEATTEPLFFEFRLGFVQKVKNKKPKKGLLSLLPFFFSLASCHHGLVLSLSSRVLSLLTETFCESSLT